MPNKIEEQVQSWTSGMSGGWEEGLRTISEGDHKVEHFTLYRFSMHTGGNTHVTSQANSIIFMAGNGCNASNSVDGLLDDIVVIMVESFSIHKPVSCESTPANCGSPSNYLVHMRRNKHIVWILTPSHNFTYCPLCHGEIHVNTQCLQKKAGNQSIQTTHDIAQQHGLQKCGSIVKGIASLTAQCKAT